MRNRLPVDAFEYYYALGERRSYQAVAENYGVSKRAVNNLAAREQWQSQVEERDRQVRESLGQKCLESLDEMQERHLKTLKAIQGRAIEALRAMPLSSGMEAVRALELAIRQERMVRGDPTERTTATRTEDEIDELIVARREVDRKMREMDRMADRLATQRQLTSGGAGEDSDDDGDAGSV